MIILVPTCEHVDRTAELCDYSSWRRRGWCRLELMGSQLSRSQLRVMLCNGGLAQPVLITPVDIVHLVPGMGEYTCCARNHGEQDRWSSMVFMVTCEEHTEACIVRVYVATTYLYTLHSLTLTLSIPVSIPCRLWRRTRYSLLRFVCRGGRFIKND